MAMCRIRTWAKAWLPIAMAALFAVAIPTRADDRDELISTINRAVALHEQGKYAEAAPLYERALRIRENVLGPDHPDVADTLYNLAALYRTQRQVAKALPLCERALRIKETARGPDHSDVADILHQMALLYEDEELFAKALP